MTVGYRSVVRPGAKLSHVEGPGALGFKRLSRLILVVGGLMTALPLAANAQMRDPNVQKIDAVVNDAVISAYDVDQRVNLLLTSVNVQITPEQRIMLRRQALQNLIDEKLQVQEARKFELEIDDAEIDETIQAIAQQYSMSTAQFEAMLGQSGASLPTLKEQLRAEIAWNRLVRGRFRQQIDVSEEDVEVQIERLKQSAGQNEYQVSEIFLLVDSPGRDNEVREGAQRIIEQLKQGVPFNVMARQFSEAPTAAVGGDLGWVQEGQLSAEVAQAVANLRPNELSDPVRTTNGYYVVKLNDRRKVLTPDKTDERFTLQQALFAKTAGEQLGAAATRINQSISAAGIKSCDDLTDAAKIGAQDLNRVGTMRLGDLPPPVQNTIEQVPAGQHSAPIDTEEGYRVLFVCERTMPESKIPTTEQVSDQMSQQRLSLMSRRYLRDLRRDAIIDIRG